MEFNNNNKNNKDTLYINPVDSEFSFFVKPNINTNSMVNNNNINNNGTSIIIAQPILQSPLPPGFSEIDIKNNIKASNSNKLSTSTTTTTTTPLVIQPDQAATTAAQFQIPSPLLPSKEFYMLMDEFSKFDFDTSLNNSSLLSTPSLSLPSSLNFMEDMNHLFDNPPPPVNFSYFSIGQSGITDFFNTYSSLMDNNYYSSSEQPINTAAFIKSVSNSVVVGAPPPTNIIDNQKAQIKNSNYVFKPTIQQQQQTQPSQQLQP